MAYSAVQQAYEIADKKVETLRIAVERMRAEDVRKAAEEKAAQQQVDTKRER
ncbi:hypothetical protein AB9F45_10715 [Rhizobium leguminosarum]|uniref:hypothetical protein n=1 Tax=Rhizobium leguminosarum TaxID=384 RepID=UPI003F9EB89A